MFGAGDDDLSFVSNNRLCRVLEGNKDIETVFNKQSCEAELNGAAI